ncbi:MAG: hypothetical protein IAE80_03795 [Anaerolinea sp.]|nr:hypothetical protein [Anaerolinea sp.]
MKRLMIVMLVMLLAACGGQPEPTATPVPPTPIPATDASAGGGIQATSALSEIQQTVAFAEPGTLIPAGVGTMQAPDAPPFAFDRVLFTQTGGLAGVNIQIDVYADGRVIRNGTESRASEDAITNLNRLLEAINIFNLSGQFMSPGAAADAFTYSLTVVKGGSNRTIMSQDGYTPQELFEIYDAIRAFGQ